MKRIVVLALAASLLGGTAALAAPGPGGPGGGANCGGPGQPACGPAQPAGDHGKPDDQHGNPGDQHGQPSGDRHGDQQGQQPGGQQGGQQTGPLGGQQHDSNVNNRGDRQRVDLKQYRRNLRSPKRFRFEPYQAPRGYHYRRYHYGQRLPGLYFARDFWLLDFLRFGLFAPPPGYVWVRYGPDALLIDQDTGEIVQVRYNVFY